MVRCAPSTLELILLPSSHLHRKKFAFRQQSSMEMDDEDELKADTVRDYLSEEGKAKVRLDILVCFYKP